MTNSFVEQDGLLIHRIFVIRKEVGQRKNTYKAIAEWPTDSSLGNGGRADYALFIGETLVAVIEAKKNGYGCFGALNIQAKDYAKNIKSTRSEIYLEEISRILCSICICYKMAVLI